MASGRFFVGVDLGQARDFTAIAVVERADQVGEWDAAMFAYRKERSLRLRHLERVALGTPYPEVVERVKHVAQWGELAGNCYVAVDATGVGRPVVDLLRPLRVGMRLMPAVFTAGDTETKSDGFYRVPKRDLITRIQVLLQAGGLQIASGLAEGRTLVEELMAMRVRVTGTGRPTSPLKERQHKAFTC